MGTDRDDQLTRRAEEIAAVEMPRRLERTRGSEALFQRAVGSMPGGVASSFQLGDPYPVYLSRGVGAEVVVVGLGDKHLMEIVHTLVTEDQMVLDLVDIPDHHKLKGDYRGVCW